MRATMSLFLAVGLLLSLRLSAFTAPVLLDTDGVDADHYDIALTLTHSSALPGKSQLSIGCGKTQITLTKNKMLIAVSANDKAKQLAQFAAEIPPDVPYSLTILRRGEWLGLLHDDELLYRGRVPDTTVKPTAMITAEEGWVVAKTQIRSREPIAFSDNFMRTADVPGQWIIHRGQWMLHSVWDNDPRNRRRRFDLVEFAQNPFAWVGRAPDGSALCTVGTPDWDDYTLTTAVQPAVDGAVGVLVNMTSPDNGLLVRWTSLTDHSAGGDTISLCRLEGGKLTTLAQAHGGFLPGQWYALAVVSNLEGVHVLIDGRERLAASGVIPWRGGVGLYAEGEGGVFNDVTAYGRTLKTDLIAEHRLARFAERVKDDQNGMGEWSTVQGDWRSFPGAPTYLLHRLPFYGDHWLTLPVRVLKSSHATALTMVLDSNGRDTTSGVRAVLQRAAGNGVVTCTLLRQSKLLATKTLPPLAAGDTYTFRFFRVGQQLGLEMDGAVVLSAEDAAPVEDHYTAFALDGALLPAGDALALGHNVLDYSFAEAPVDWLAAGAWMPTNRWACSSHWSFLGGWSRGDAVLWQKKRFTGDQLFESFVATKMEYPRERQVYWHNERERDYAITICGDGHNPRSGYSGIFAAAESFVTPDKRTVLLRDGVVVGSVTISPPEIAKGHTAWFHLELRKQGATVEFWVCGQLALRYTDPHPIDGGVPAIWTTDNGIAVARARMSFANTPELRGDAQVSLDDPWYPSWANVGQPLSVDFLHAASTTGQPVRLQVTPRQVPGEEHASAELHGTRVTLTPQAAGDHWYEIRAGDGIAQSPAFHLAVPVFTPTLGRDDTHAVVLYRFDEGQGDIIKDHGTGPAADLIIPVHAPVTWKAGQGLALHGLGPIKTAGGVPKLMALARNKAATIEAWIDTDTLCPPTDWLGGLLAWELPGEQRNITIAHMCYHLTVMPCGTSFEPYHGGAAFTNCIRSGLQHVVVTWDGKVTRSYVNGEKAGENTLDWHADCWLANTPLLLGSLAEGQPHYHDIVARFLGPRADILADAQDLQHCYLGSFYLAAIHDRCFSDAEVKHNYLAGPSAPSAR